MPALVAAIAGFGFSYGAYMADVFRSGIEAVPKEQGEAARSLGMNEKQALTKIIAFKSLTRVKPVHEPLFQRGNLASLVKIHVLPRIIFLPVRSYPGFVPIRPDPVKHVSSAWIPLKRGLPSESHESGAIQR